MTCQSGSGKPFIAMGSVTIILSIISVVFQAAVMGADDNRLYTSWYTRIGTGIWCGAISIIPGILCILISKRLNPPHNKPTALLGATLGMSIVSIIFCLVFLTLSVIFTLSRPYRCYVFATGYIPCPVAVKGLTIVLSLAALAQLSTSIAILVYSSYHICCRRSLSGRAEVSASYTVPVQGMTGSPIQLGCLVQGPGQCLYVVPMGSVPPGFTQVNVQQVGPGLHPESQENQPAAVTDTVPPSFYSAATIPGIKSAVLTHPK